MPQGLSGVRKRAKERKQEKFTALLHHLTVGLSPLRMNANDLEGRETRLGAPSHAARSRSKNCGPFSRKFLTWGARAPPSIERNASVCANCRQRGRASATRAGESARLRNSRVIKILLWIVTRHEIRISRCNVYDSPAERLAGFGIPVVPASRVGVADGRLLALAVTVSPTRLRIRKWCRACPRRTRFARGQALRNGGNDAGCRVARVQTQAVVNQLEIALDP